MHRRHTCWNWIVPLAVVVLGATDGWSQRRFGYIPTPKEVLIKIQVAESPLCRGVSGLPESVDLSSQLPPPGYQGNQGSCAAWSVAYGLKTQQEKITQRWSLTDSGGQANPAHVFSPAYVYNQLNNGRDGGIRLDIALDLLVRNGAATLAEMPYDEYDYTRQPDGATIARARRYRIDSYRRINPSDINGLKVQLNSGFPVVIGAQVDKGFCKPGRPGYIWSRPDEETVGGHAMLLMGYDNSKSAFKVMNSWGRDWGDRGFGWIAYDYFPRVVESAFIAKNGVNDPGSNPIPGPGSDGLPPIVPPVRQQPAFRITSVTHGLQDRNGITWMRFEGDLMVPPGCGRQEQVVIHFYYDAGNGRKGYGVGATSPQYSDVRGFAAAGTQPYSVPPYGLTAHWWAMVPYSALALTPGGWVMDPYARRIYQPRVSYLLAEPVLFLDNFGVATGGLLPFSVSH